GILGFLVGRKSKIKADLEIQRSRLAAVEGTLMNRRNRNSQIIPQAERLQGQIRKVTLCLQSKRLANDQATHDVETEERFLLLERSLASEIRSRIELLQNAISKDREEYDQLSPHFRIAEAEGRLTELNALLQLRLKDLERYKARYHTRRVLGMT